MEEHAEVTIQPKPTLTTRVGHSYRLKSRRLHESRLSPQTIQFSEFDRDYVTRILPDRGLVVIKNVPEEEMVNIMPSGAVALPQYEGVFAGLEDPYTMRIVAEAKPAIHTTAFKQKSTTKHQDAYQFPSRYRGVEIAGPGNMPDYEVLGYPRVGDKRLLLFAGLRWAAEQLPRDLYDRLHQPDFIIENDEYQRLDPDLRGGTTAVIYDDGEGLRFHVGSKIRGINSDAEFALSALMEIADEDKCHFWLEPGDVYLTWQRWVCHNAIRSNPSSDQEPTVLIRRLLRRKPKTQ
jgi:hypothetical protein